MRDVTTLFIRALFLREDFIVIVNNLILRNIQNQLNSTYFRALHRHDSVYALDWIVENLYINGRSAQPDPGLFVLGLQLENVRFAREQGLFTIEEIKTRIHNWIYDTV